MSLVEGLITGLWFVTFMTLCYAHRVMAGQARTIDEQNRLIKSIQGNRSRRKADGN